MERGWVSTRDGGDFVVVRKLAARIGLAGLSALMVLGGGFGAVGPAVVTATGATGGAGPPPPHPNV